MEKDKPLDPPHVGFLGLIAVVSRPYRLWHVVQKLGFCGAVEEFTSGSDAGLAAGYSRFSR